MENIYQENDDAINIFKEECEQILIDFAKQLDLYEKESDINIITKLMRDAHSVKGSAGISGFVSVQKYAHKIEDLLSAIKTLKENKILPDKKSDEKNLISEIKQIIIRIAEELKKNKEKFNVFEDSFYLNFLKQISVLKTDINVSNELSEYSKVISDNVNTAEVKDIAECLYNIFSKMHNKKDINSNIINTLSGAVKIIKKITADKNDYIKEELIFIKQRLSVVEQMLSSIPVRAIKSERTDTIKKQENVIPDIFKILGQDSIKTLRIDTTKLDKLYENVIKLENISKKEKSVNKDLINSFEIILGGMFEFEKIAATLKNISYKTDVQDKNYEIIEKCHKAALQMEKNIKKIQKKIPDYENLRTESSKNEFTECLQEVQTTVKNIRILPIGVILHMFPRMARDIASALNKEIVIEIKGSETGVDKKIIEEIKMPLIHILRNAIDHGIKSPEERKNQGKSPIGKIEITAHNQNENFVISVKDDGCGINFDKIKEKALKEKLLGNSEIKKYKRQDFLNMLFKPGFSTEDKITEFSGRGMGLDIVYTSITALNGHIKINTIKDKGTEIIMTIPSGYYGEINNEKISKNNNKKYKIMLVDDSKTTLFHFSKLLKNAGYEVCTKENAKEGLKELKTNSYDLLISDVEMSGMNGEDFIIKLRKNKNLKNLPVIIISMLEKKRLEELFKNLNVNAIFNKTEYKEPKFLYKIEKILKDKV